jgi:transcriptional regulator with XRE-family HTH domain
MTDTTSAAVREHIRARRDLPPPQLRRALRVAAGMSQQDVANVVRCSRAAVGYWESGARMPRGELLARYAEALRTMGEEA